MPKIAPALSGAGINTAALWHQPERSGDRQGDERAGDSGTAAGIEHNGCSDGAAGEQLIRSRCDRKARLAAGLSSFLGSGDIATVYRSAILSSRSKNSGKLIAADSAP